MPPGFPYLELRAIAESLAGEGVFVPGYRPPAVGLCHPDSFIFQSHFEGIRTVLQPDRNIVSRMARIVAGEQMDPTLRKVAAIKAFCHFLDIGIEPAIAFHELASVQGNDRANAELALFRDADDADPYPWLDLFFGDSQALAPFGSHRPVESHDLAFPLRRWRRNYIAALKIAELELSARCNIDRMLVLLDWMHDDFMIAGPAALLACIYFAPNSPPRKGLFKQLRAKDRSRAIRGVRNAAWDLTHLSEMIKVVNESAGDPRRILFASFDEGLRALARLIFMVGADELDAGRLGLELSKWWTGRDADRIASSLCALLACVEDEHRRERRARFPVTIDQMIQQGEDALSTASLA